jgi:hypothetical protein
MEGTSSELVGGTVQSFYISIINKYLVGEISNLYVHHFSRIFPELAMLN